MFNSLHETGSGIPFFLHTWHWRSNYLLEKYFISSLTLQKVHLISRYSNTRLLNSRSNSSFHSHLLLYPIHRLMLPFYSLYRTMSGHQHEKCEILQRRKEFKEVKLMFKPFLDFLLLSKCQLKMSDGFVLERSNLILAS